MRRLVVRCFDSSEFRRFEGLTKVELRFQSHDLISVVDREESTWQWIKESESQKSGGSW
jgi:hypothetical protein